MYRLNDEQQRIAAIAAAVADRDLAPRAADVDRDAAFPRDSIAALGAGGLLGLNVPKDTAGSDRGRGRPPPSSTPSRSAARLPRWST